MKRTATTEQAEDSNAAGTHALTREQRCGARQAWQSGDLQRWLQALAAGVGRTGERRGHMR
jgi:hypothetical protein